MKYILGRDDSGNVVYVFDENDIEFTLDDEVPPKVTFIKFVDSENEVVKTTTTKP